MAHSCPDCGSICYCGGDIDDMCFDDSDEQTSCTHYKQCDPEDPYEDDDEEYAHDDEY